MTLRNCWCVLASLLITSSIYAQGPSFKWVQSIDIVSYFSPGGNVPSSGNLIAVDSAGDAIVAGAYSAPFTIGQAKLFGMGVFLAKYDTYGNPIWAKQVSGTSGQETPDAVAIDAAGNIFVTWWYPHKIVFLAKYDWKGDCQWVIQAGGSGQTRGYGVAADAEGNSYLTGDFLGTVSFGSQQPLVSTGREYDAFVAKFDVNGQCLWARQCGGLSTDAGAGISVDKLGNAYVTGFFIGASGASAQFGDITLTSSAYYTMFIAKFDTAGKTIWAKRAAGFSKGFGISNDSEGNSMVTGFIMGLTAFDGFQVGDATGDGRTFIAKYDPQGACTWVTTNTGGSPQGEMISIDEKGSSFIAGTFQSAAEFGNQSIVGAVNGHNTFMCKYDAQGKFVWVKNPECRISDTVMPTGGIATDGKGSVWLYGYHSAICQFDTITSNPKGTFIAKLADWGAGVDAVSESKPGTPASFELMQNYPNPFNPTTTIQFSLTQRSPVSLKVYDVLGREISTLISEVKETGLHQVQWNASGMASGVYFYRLHAGAYTDTKRLVLTK